MDGLTALGGWTKISTFTVTVFSVYLYIRWDQEAADGVGHDGRGP